MKLEGKISFFGGQNDSGMAYNEGLALYEHEESDLRPDLFLARSTDPTEGTSKRLRTTSNYIAIRFDRTLSREYLKNITFHVVNPRTGQFVLASLVDFGPAVSTGRIVDLSPAIGLALRVETDDELMILENV